MHADIINDFIQIDFIPRENTLHLSDTMEMTDRREMVASRYYNPFSFFPCDGILLLQQSPTNPSDKLSVTLICNDIQFRNGLLLKTNNMRYLNISSCNLEIKLQLSLPVHKAIQQAMHIFIFYKTRNAFLIIYIDRLHCILQGTMKNDE